MSIFRRCQSLLERMRTNQIRRRLLRHCEGGEGLRVRGVLNVMQPGRLRLGRNVYLGPGVSLQCRGGMTIGENTIISHDVMIYSYDHDFHDPEALPYGPGVIERPVAIGRDVWIGARATIAPGTTIGDAAVIGMGAVISGHVPAGAVVVAPKWRIVGQRDPQTTPTEDIAPDSHDLKLAG